MRFFRFKQFQITDDHSAMKVGTDSVILGAWANQQNVKTVLDIGSGAGLLSLMLAQRNSISRVTAVEIDNDAVEDAKYNFNNSTWSNRLSVIHSDIRSFQAEEKFDLIISNPPFFKDSLLPDIHARAGARHDEHLSLDDLLSFVKKHLNHDGHFTLVFPFDRERELLSLAKIKGLFPCRIMRSMNKPSAQIKRSFIELSYIKTEAVKIDLLEIRNAESEYSEAYKELTKEFYLKF